MRLKRLNLQNYFNQRFKITFLGIGSLVQKRMEWSKDVEKEKEKLAKLAQSHLFYNYTERKDQINFFRNQFTFCLNDPRST